MHKFAFCWGSAADPFGRALTPDGDLLAVFTGLLPRGRRESGRKEKRGENGGERREKRRKEGFGPPKNFGVAPPMT